MARFDRSSCKQCLRCVLRLGYFKEYDPRLNSGSGHVAGAALAAAGFALGIFAATVVRPVSLPRAASVSSMPPVSPRASFGSSASVNLPGYPAEVIRMLDGDTFEARMWVWPGMNVTAKVRLRGIDAPELRARCNEERIAAVAARDALSALLSRGQVRISRVSLGSMAGACSPMPPCATPRTSPMLSSSLAMSAATAAPDAGAGAAVGRIEVVLMSWRRYPRMRGYRAAI